MFLITRSSIARLAAVAVLVLGAAVVWLAVVGGGSSARATVADGDVVLGDSEGPSCTPGKDANCASATTGITTTSGQSAFFGQATGSGTGVSGNSDSGDGVFGQSNSGVGVDASSLSNFGLFALSSGGPGGLVQTDSQSGIGLQVIVNNTSNATEAIEATTNGPAAGVLASAISGPGVEGVSTSGSGVLGVAKSTNATALQAKGRTTLSGPTTLAGASSFTGTTSFARSGKLAIAANGSQATKTGIALSASSVVLATIQGNVPGVYVQGVTLVTGSSGSFTVHLNKATPTALSVGWFIVN